jgi:hypothetical protein
MLLTFFARREMRRDAVFSLRTRLWTARRISGSATCSALRAASGSPAATACSTLLMNVRTRLARARLISVRLAVCRIRFFAER